MPAGAMARAGKRKSQAMMVSRLMSEGDYRIVEPGAHRLWLIQPGGQLLATLRVLGRRIFEGN